ncbi:hypothetical protein L1987_64003 [Smallanthus sonchifolius]|uniref:Uncharacterized protein n=1 Tax=Smallanthus sonchifolius TaxID=185202 RepID=A0ACB9CEX3_9ASTR|nr:hypothetical protein L1987_64003 [Smallanthus sonchifolius]
MKAEAESTLLPFKLDAIFSVKVDIKEANDCPLATSFSVSLTTNPLGVTSSGSTMATGQIFSRTTHALFYNYKQLLIQQMLDFDFLCQIYSAAASSKLYLKHPTIRVVAIIAEGVLELDTKELISYARLNNKAPKGEKETGLDRSTLHCSCNPTGMKKLIFQRQHMSIRRQLYYVNLLPTLIPIVQRHAIILDYIQRPRQP